MKCKLSISAGFPHWFRLQNFINVIYFCTFNIIQNNLQSHVWLINNAIVTVCQKTIHCSLEMLNNRKMEFFTFFFLNLMKIFFKKLKLPSTKFCVYGTSWHPKQCEFHQKGTVYNAQNNLTSLLQCLRVRIYLK